MTKKRLGYIVGVILIVIILPGIAGAQPGGPDDPPCWPPSTCPIDLNVLWLLLAGLIFGGKKLQKSR